MTRDCLRRYSGWQWWLFCIFFSQRASFSLTKIGHMLPIGQRYAQPILKKGTPKRRPSDTQVTPKWHPSDTQATPRWRPSDTQVTPGGANDDIILRCTLPRILELFSSNSYNLTLLFCGPSNPGSGFSKDFKSISRWLLATHFNASNTSRKLLKYFKEFTANNWKQILLHSKCE